MPVLYWLIAAAVFLFIEIITLSLVSIWFVGGALAGAFTAYLMLPLWVQLLAFAVISAALFAAIMPLARKSLDNKKQDTNIDSLIGSTGLVIRRIDNLAAVGQVNLHGQVWSARSYSDDVIIEEGQKVLVHSIEGVKLIVTPNANGGIIDA